jgi:hypothetical protein
MIPTWLHVLSIAALVVGFVSALVIVADEWRDPQHMWIMNAVWPITALFGGFVSLRGYFAYGKHDTKRQMAEAHEKDQPMPGKQHTPFPVMVGKGTAHCGSGCTLGDIAAEWLAFAFPAIAIAFGWKGLFAEKMFAVWIPDYILAFIFGIVFQYFSIKPMRNLTPLEGIVEAVKADALSLTAWQIGMYGFMALAHFWFFGTLLGARLEVDSVEFWFMMQIGMFAGFATSYPVNWWLIRRGVKEEM